MAAEVAKLAQLAQLAQFARAFQGFAIPFAPWGNPRLGLKWWALLKNI
jgi:hypothetical protein